jgi:hypothetical protein
MARPPEVLARKEPHMNDLWPTKDAARSIGCQLRAGKQPQHNPPAGSAHRVHGWRAAASRTARCCVEFAEVWWQYRRAHSWRYAARIAYEIAFRGCPF